MIVGLSGELALSGDDLTTITTEKLEIFKKWCHQKKRLHCVKQKIFIKRQMKIKVFMPFYDSA